MGKKQEDVLTGWQKERRGKEKYTKGEQTGKEEAQGVDGSPGCPCHCYITPDPQWGPFPHHVSPIVSNRTSQHDGPQS